MLTKCKVSPAAQQATLNLSYKTNHEMQTEDMLPIAIILYCSLYKESVPVGVNNKADQYFKGFLFA